MNQRKSIKKRCLDYIKSNKVILAFFLATTAFFIYQHSIMISWDFATYVLNAKYWFANGTYFEPFRPPLMSLVIGILAFFGWRLSEYLYLVLVAFLFMHSSKMLAKTLKFNKEVFYSISLSAYILNYGLINGTELLSLVLLEYGIVFLLKDDFKSGIMFGLGALSRYTGFALFPLLLFHSIFRKALASLTFFIGTVSMWFIYNHYKYGNFFTSISDLYAINVPYRGYMIQPIVASHFIEVQYFLMPFFLAGLIIILYRLAVSFWQRGKLRLIQLIGKIKEYRAEIIMSIILVFSLHNYIMIPTKDIRYLFYFVVPTTYFSYIGIEYTFRKLINKKRLFWIAGFIIFLINISIGLIHVQSQTYDTPGIYEASIVQLKNLNISECAVMSDSWVMLNYLGQESIPFQRVENIQSKLDRGHSIILFQNSEEMRLLRDASILEQLSIKYEDDKFLIFKEAGCIPPIKFDKTYIEQLSDIIYDLHGYHINQNPCFILFHESEFMEKACNLINFKGYEIDKNRVFE